ncbi:hypothetical protein HRR83_004573 [Exophiala dermatitidis]|nr:hypothetical protein HRR83_004573 [Exophiala dermatitidis]
MIKRPRPVISCLECRRKKLKCDRTHPCRQCLKIGRPGRCQYQDGQEPEPNAAHLSATGPASKRRSLDQESLRDTTGTGDARGTGDEYDEHFAQRRGQHSASPSAAAGRAVGVIKDLQQRVAKLEQALLSQDQHQLQRSGSGRSIDPNQVPTRPNVLVSDNLSNGAEEGGSSSSLRPRAGSQFPDACLFLQRLQDGPEGAEMVSLRSELKSLHDAIATTNRRRDNDPPRSTPAALSLPRDSAHQLASMSVQFPPFDVCEKLAVHYFDNLEHCFRILHWPEFRTQLEIFSTPGQGDQSCKFGFVPQLVGVLATACTLGTHPECDAGASYPILQQPIALKYIQDFLASLPDRQRYLFPTLQAKMLMLMLRWMSVDKIDDLFRLNGEILRDALVMKLDQDPSTGNNNNTSIFEGELRRRCWMTIVECDLMLCILCKLPCMVPPYTTQQPRNVNDDELFEGMDRLPPSHPLEEWTDGLCQYVLAQSFPRRLAACKQMDSSSGHVIELKDVLLHTRYLEQVLRDLPPPLRFSYTGDRDSKTPPRLMARMELDISIRRPLMHLYSRCAAAAGVDDDDSSDNSDSLIQQTHEARAGFLRSCLMLITFQDLFDPQFSEINVPRPKGYWDFFHNVYRCELGQAILGLCLEIKRLSLSSAEEDRDTPTNSFTPLNSTTTAGGTSTGTQTPQYSRESIIDSVKDILGPMKRRLLQHQHEHQDQDQGAKANAIANANANLNNFRDIIYLTVVLTSVLPLSAEQEQQDMQVPEVQIGPPHTTTAGTASSSLSLSSITSRRQMMIYRALNDFVHDCRAEMDPSPTQRSERPGNDPHRSRRQEEEEEEEPQISSRRTQQQQQKPTPTAVKFDPTWAEFPDLEFLDCSPSPSPSSLPLVVTS